MKTELITNVSHDLKTPLTAIITYVNLLKEKNLTEEQIQSYVDTLDKKSLRLKRLIEDLFEVSKANSGNVQLNLQNCDLANLIKQCFYEVEGQFEEKKLTTRLSMPEGKILLKLDSEKTYRIYENLFNNIVKYAMSGTRVYLSMVEEKDTIVVTVKNITEAELYVPAEELTERFVRGDASRGSIEGSGLGLAIARSFTEIQGGRFEIDVDGDLFKVTTTWRKPWGQEAK
jgi:signal transduction histidine kinase